jgi:cell wall-associated NlpC family hydrolase
MADTGEKTLTKRQSVIELAQDQIGCHYVWGGAGNTPGNEDGAFYRRGAVKMHDNETGPPPKAHADHGRKVAIILAAYCRVDGYKVCVGRSRLTEVMALERGDTNDPTLFDSEYTDLYSWPRPDMVIDSNLVGWGESCDGVRHFDCIGFINWCLSEEVRPFHHSIQQVIDMTKEIAKGRAPVGEADIRAGDILTVGAHHLGFASGDGTAVHASSTHRGVVEDSLIGPGWDRVGRLPSSFWGV